ncbi:HAD family phosphatase [Methanohalophilus sp.]|uniref:HAD family hydrolase n=1 Tax=Methanohalophilus sp. TaxID=1966352 RepID=UPI0026389762|nr:HAD family phosphatase [Methanohalophilus sp.]MDK2892942.1 beta-phosphoglucomutase [Methanohalophilus sp.]
MYKALIFDMDGILIDSMPSHVSILSEVFAEVGVSIDPEIIYEMEGAKTIDIVYKLLEKAGIDPSSLDLDGILAKYRREFEKRASFTPFENLRLILPSLKEKFLLAVVSGADRSIVHSIINSIYPSVFDIVITGDDVDFAKPNPDPFLKAAEMLGVDKKECIVIENAILGVEAAKQAGMYCVAVPTYIEPFLLSDADIIFEDHDELVEYLKSL